MTLSSGVTIQDNDAGLVSQCGKQNQHKRELRSERRRMWCRIYLIMPSLLRFRAVQCRNTDILISYDVLWRIHVARVAFITEVEWFAQISNDVVYSGHVEVGKRKM